MDITEEELREQGKYTPEMFGQEIAFMSDAQVKRYLRKGEPYYPEVWKRMGVVAEKMGKRWIICLGSQPKRWLQSPVYQRHASELGQAADVLALNMERLFLSKGKKILVHGDIVSGGHIEFIHEGRKSMPIYSPSQQHMLVPVDSERAKYLLQHIREKLGGRFRGLDWTAIRPGNVEQALIDMVRKIALSPLVELLGTYCDICQNWDRDLV